MMHKRVTHLSLVSGPHQYAHHDDRKGAAHYRIPITILSTTAALLVSCGNGGQESPIGLRSCVTALKSYKVAVLLTVLSLGNEQFKHTQTTETPNATEYWRSQRLLRDP